MQTSVDINQWSSATPSDPLFPAAPVDWTRVAAQAVAEDEDLVLTEEHWEAVRALQGYRALLADWNATMGREYPAAAAPANPRPPRLPCGGQAIQP